ncbi:MAG TPA: hypothetical protein VNR42_00900, partial [Solirubrobacteraceae bacterium]|nr:hypothetical protein [Solirubrobacteraceae bacterium]
MAACLLSATAALSQAAPRHHASRGSRTAVVPRALQAAASRTVRADHALVADAKSLEACLRKHGPRSSACAAEHAAVQHAGRSLAIAKRHLALVARSRARAHKASNAGPRRAPQLSVSGTLLSWTRIERVSTYVLARRTPGQPNQYSIVHGTSTSPPPVPGVTVSYSVRTAVAGSTWSGWQHMSYPAPVVLPPAPGETPAPSSEPPNAPPPS